MFAEIALELPVTKHFDYSIPESLTQRAKPGMRVWIPFGNRRVLGYILKIKGATVLPQTKEIIKLIDSEPLLSEDLIKLAEWISEYYCCQLGKVFRAMLPGRIRQISPRRDEIKYVRIIKPAGDMGNLVKRAPKQAHVLDVLCKQKSAIRLMDLARMAKTTPGIINSLYKKGLVDVFSGRIDRDPYKEERFQSTIPHVLNDEQKHALTLIIESDPCVVLLQGITGSGKTEVYLQAIDEVLKRGKTAIVIVPEISLTPQTVERFKSRFNEGVAVLHSKLGEGERYDQWQKTKLGHAKIVIGARSAIFAPVRNLGIIIVDEEHEKTYKQEEEPRYHAKDVAIKRAQIQGATVVLGSATPSLESYYLAKQGKYKLVKLTNRIDNRPLAEVSVINMKEEIKKFKKLLTFSPFLIRHISERLLKKQQIILFLNRRGFSPFIICRKCGFVVRCANCTTALTYHQLGDKLVCHTCDFTDVISRVCPECSDPHIRFGGIGTQRVESQIAKFFPAACIRRLDTDVTTLKGIHKKIFDEFKSRKTDILVGTQMIAKGLDFPNVTLVGVISADVALHLPDFRAGEHTFQLLTQVAGRAGRGEVPGEVVIQTMTPEHPSIQMAATQDFDNFAQKELAIRRELDYPPYEHFLNINFRSRNPQKAELVSRRFHKLLEEKNKETKIKIYGAIPAPFARLRGYYRWQVLLKAPDTELLFPLVKETLALLGKPEGVFIAIDVDPIDML